MPSKNVLFSITIVPAWVEASSACDRLPTTYELDVGNCPGMSRKALR